MTDVSNQSTGIDAVRRLGERGPFRARELDPLGVPRAYLRRMVERGLLEQLSRGVYAAPGFPVTELHSLVQVALRAPHASICLLSALQVHGLTTEAPHAVWVLIGTHSRVPTSRWPRLKVVRAGGEALTHGVETRIVEGVPLRVTTPAKTVADCFRYRRHVGLEVALTALRDFLARSRQRRARDARRFNVDALEAAARADRISTVLRPYLEALA